MSLPHDPSATRSTFYTAYLSHGLLAPLHDFVGQMLAQDVAHGFQADYAVREPLLALSCVEVYISDSRHVVSSVAVPHPCDLVPRHESLLIMRRPRAHGESVWPAPGAILVPSKKVKVMVLPSGETLACMRGWFPAPQ